MYFYDSYAIIEIAKGNPRYRPYLVGEGLTSKLNLLEVYSVLLQQGQGALAESCYHSRRADAVDFPGELIPTVAHFRHSERGRTQRRFSYLDSLGYVYARSLGCTFLTGAHEFEGLPDVEFVR
jgi:hypothetical protein